MLTAAAFLIAYTVGCLLALVRHPVYGLATYVTLIYVHPPAQWWGERLPSIRWSLVAAVVTMVALMFYQSTTKNPRLFEFGVMKVLLLFVAWLGIQFFWALNQPLHLELLVLFVKYTLLAALIYMCIETVDHLRIFLWAHSAGCFYLGIIVFSSYIGGRFDGFEGPGISEGNAAALLLVTGILTTFVLFLNSRFFGKVAAVGFMPFTLNALVATISRSGFLALGVAGLLFNLFVPRKAIRAVRIFSILGLVLFVLLANPVFWERIGTILVAGEDIQGVDTGSNRIVLIEAQLEMFSEYPLGCGHRCTAVLSPYYLNDKYLTGDEDNRARSSHNTFMTLLVEQGIPGAIFYIFLIIWTVRVSLAMKENMRSKDGLIPTTYAATVAILGAIFVGDLFVDYLKFEARIWFIAVLMALFRMDVLEKSKIKQSSIE